MLWLGPSPKGPGAPKDKTVSRPRLAWSFGRCTNRFLRGDRRKNGPKGPNEATKRFRITGLTCGTNPHEPKTKPLSSLDLMGVLKRTQNQGTSGYSQRIPQKRQSCL